MGLLCRLLETTVTQKGRREWASKEVTLGSWLELLGCGSGCLFKGPTAGTRPPHALPATPGLSADLNSLPWKHKSVEPL